jgi:rSAM/selenodomain-associated transferase 2
MHFLYIPIRIFFARRFPTPIPENLKMNHSQRKYRFPGTVPYQPVRRISAVVPTLNEGDCIHGCISSLLRQSEIIEIIVSDGGSTDDTRALSAMNGARVIQSRHRGRGFQLFEGIAHTSGDVILAVHADCRLQNGAAGRVLAALNADPLLAGGAFGMAFTSRMHRLELIALLNNLRTCLIGISFGDQGQFFRREALQRIGGFPRQMLMEDVELSLRLKAAGRVTLMPQGILVSPRRWKTQSFASRTVQVLYLFTRYLLARRKGCIQKTAEDFYRRYYG